MLPTAPGVRNQVLHSVPHSRHAQGPLRSHAEGKVPDARDDVRGRTGAPAEGEEEERTAVSPRVALASPFHIRYTVSSFYTSGSPQLPGTTSAIGRNMLALRVWLHSADSVHQRPETKSCSTPVWLQALIPTLAICSASSVGASLGFWLWPLPPCPTQTPSAGSIQQIALICAVVAFLYTCNVYYADQGLQFASAHSQHPSCTLSVCVWQLATTPHPTPCRPLTLQSAAGCSLVLLSPHERQWGKSSAGHVTALCSISFRKSDSTNLATKYNVHCSRKATVYCPDAC